MTTYALAGPVERGISWQDLFRQEMPERQRRERWAEWLRTARREPESRDAAEYWTDDDGCRDCKHLRGRAWCSLQGLPCTVNPVTTIRLGCSMVGMACMGLGYERRPAGRPAREPKP